MLAFLHAWIFWQIWILRASPLNRGVWHVTAVEPISGYIAEFGGFWSKPSEKSCDKTTWDVVSTWNVLWSARLYTSKVTGNQQEVRSSQSEVTRRSVRPLSRLLGAHRSRHQRGWTAIDRHLFRVNIRRMGLGGKDRHGVGLRNTSLTVGVVWRPKSTKLWELSCMHSLDCKA